MSTKTSNRLLTPVTVGPYALANRMVMAPMTRNRAPEGIPTELTATYYEQRASAGLLVTEGSQVSQQGVGYLFTPGIHTDAQVEGWRRVTEAVHRRGGRIFVQLWHVGRISHPSFQPDGAAPVAPSALRPEGLLYTPAGQVPFVEPRALSVAEIAGIVDDFARAAANAKAAGFDGVELHGANGYLIDQFLRDGTNQRRDAYGGSVLNRTRFLVDVTEAVAGAIGAERVGVRLSPVNPFNDIADSDPLTTFGAAARALSRYGLAYLHLVLPAALDATSLDRAILAATRDRFAQPVVLNGGFTRETGHQVIADGVGDLVAFGVPFLANPDLPERFAAGLPLNTPDRGTFYLGDARGYTDYPVRAQVVGA
jgi:N-ethylmaleimide reductase